MARARAVLLGAIAVAALAAVCFAHLSQGTAAIAPVDVLRAIWSPDAREASVILVGSRLLRLVVGLLVGAALGAAGCALQAVTRNPLASPDTLAVNAGAHLTLTASAAFGLGVGVLSGAAAALVGGLLAAGAALALSAGSRSSVRLILAGSVLALTLHSVTAVLLLLYSEETSRLFAWGSGSLGQGSTRGLLPTAVAVLVAGVGLLLLGRRLDLLQLGDDAARSLGVPVAATRLAAVALAVVLTACSVSLAGPLGFVGLCAPALARGIRRWAPGLRRQRPLLVASALCGALLVVVADIGVRAAFGSLEAVDIPTGVATTVLGAVFLVALSRRMRTGAAESSPAAVSTPLAVTARCPVRTVLAVAALVGLTAVLALLAGDGWLLLGDVANWVRGQASGRITLILDARLPRMVSALLAGAALGIAGALTQTVTRNPLADPGILGVTGGAGLGAIVTLGGTDALGIPAGYGLVTAGALVGAAVAAALLLGLTASSGADGVRLVLVGLGISAGSTALTTLLIVRSDPWNQVKAITWLGGSTYGAALPRTWVLAAALLVTAVVIVRMHRTWDLLQVDDQTPRVLGVSIGRNRIGTVALAVVLTALATALVGVIGFIGLAAPHLARLLVGPRHAVVVPLAALVGAFVVVVADAVGRSVLAPAQLPVGLVCALIGAPYFIWLMRRMRADQ
ncbi:iron ABC transporter permease [Blastococcus sp. Marseille-P5729]|uniref:iron ABC transporter permease n=1 Tax=Blastococcus sp. Marseille-P5729 TaxID=2086582 RepID=UPI000D100F2C|nr:iron ABC transporter permease [Blastococcus sp. Marseille-P5729]